MMEPTGHLGLQSHSGQTKWFTPKNCLHVFNGMVVKMFSGHRLGGFVHEANGRVFEFCKCLGFLVWHGYLNTTFVVYQILLARSQVLCQDTHEISLKLS